MIKTIKAHMNGLNVTQFVSYFPCGECPHCHTNFDGHFLSAHLISPKTDSEYVHLLVLHYCNVCNNGFLTVYASIPDGQSGFYPFKLAQTFPAPSAIVSFTPYIHQISQRFPEIYRQALQAENAGLNEICGAGYRKALEFLVKDYFSQKYPQEAERIQHEHLSVTLKRFEDKAIQSIASGCYYLGNDETHYLRKLSKPDVDLLKNLLMAIVAEIDKDGYYQSARNLK